MKKLLLTGASGFLGYNICKVPQREWQILAFVNKRHLAMANVHTMHVDLTNEVLLSAAVLREKPDAILHIAAQANPNYCQEHPQESFTVNVRATELLAQLAAQLNIPFLFTSTDLVFDGKQGNYTELDIPLPVNTYGEHKLQAEQLVMSNYPKAIICRMPLMFGNGGSQAQSFMQPFLQKMQAGEELALFEDEYRSVLGGNSAAKGLLWALEHFPAGIYHMGGKERLSRYEFGLRMQKVFHLPKAVIKPISQREISMPAPRPADVSLNSAKAYALGFSPMEIEEELRLLKD
ncbi:MAG: NAD(P)-dependent oxidoreductase [Chitinophagales bacterium]|nr:NAD(P)-dependent oxidoreductase [Chitinophagales bacterium]